MKLNNLLLICLFIFSSCSFISVHEENVSCSLNENQFYFEGDKISFNFSDSCSHIEAEESVSLLENSKTINIKKQWTANCLTISPVNEWKKGKFYNLIFDGDLKINGQNISVYIKRNFYFGAENLILKNSICSIDYPLQVKEPIVINFNNSVNPDSVYDNISFNPSIEFKTSWSNENKILSIFPKENWTANKFYKVSIKNFISENNYYLEEKDFSFQIKKDISFPELISVQKVLKNEDKYIFSESINELNDIKITDSIGFVFSNSMNYESVRNGISFSPSIEGTIISCDSENKEFVFIPENNFKSNTQYEIDFSKNIKDANGFEMKDSIIKTFVPKTDYLKILYIKVNENPVNLDNQQESSNFLLEKKNTTMNNEITTEYLCSIMISFNSDLNNEAINEITDKIRLNLKFPLTKTSPVIKNIKWLSASSLVLEYTNLSPGSKDEPVYYELKITGGINGIKNKFNEYMEENLCLILEPS